MPVALDQIPLAEDLIYDFAMRQAKNELMTLGLLWLCPARIVQGRLLLG